MMNREKIGIWAYADWSGMATPKCIGILTAHQAKGRKAFSFEYDSNWIKYREQLLLDYDLAMSVGEFFS